MNRMVKKFMVVLLSVFMFMGAVTTPVQAKGYSSDTYGWGGWWSWWWWPTQPAEPEPEPEEEPVVEGEPVAEEESAETEEPVAEEETPAVAEEPVIEEEPIAEPEPVYAEGTVYDESEHFKASVTFDTTAKLPEGTDVSVNELQEGTEAYAAAVKAVFGNEEAAADFIAVDIALVNDDTVLEPDPNGNEVIVSVELKNLPTEAIEAADTMEIQHINETSGETETVATAENITITGENSAEAEFAVGSFSTFVLKWGTEETPESATIHWGYMDGTEFVELKEGSVVTMDTTASTISLANSFEGYTYLDALYCAPGKSVEEGVDIGSTLYKTADGWECDAYSTDGEETTSSRAAIVDGSDIYVLYFIPGSPNPSGASDNTIPSPTTTKTVVPNGDGTYTIQLDITGATVTEDNSHYANILVILDATKSMDGTKWTNAKAAMKALIETLTEGENAANAGKIDFALVTFGRSATVTQGWTKNNTAFKTTCANLNMVSTSGTNWEAGMRGGLYGVLNTYPEGESEENHDPTYVIFLTDGDPNVYYSSGAATNYTNDGTTNGWSQNSNTSANHSADEAKAIAAKTKLYGIYCGSSGTTPSGDSYNRLVNVISGNGQGGQKTIAANADSIESEFKAIAQTMLDEMGASNVAVDDGVPELSNISSNVVGEAGGYKYYKKEADETEFTEWADAPGAIYSKDNGVTWDLSSAGTLPAGTTYRIKFTVWPSQDAYDLIADLNNGLKSLDDLTPEQRAGVTGSKETGYTLLTNTHLNTSYSFKDVDYTDHPEWESKAMPLPTEKISLKKLWPKNNMGDYGVAVYRDENGEEQTADSIKLTLTKDGANYLDVTVSKDGPDGNAETTEDNWTANDIYISCGQITVENGVATVKETGHDYTVIEPAAFSYYWDLIAATYHPMVINGTAKMLILDEKAKSADNVNTFKINDKYYTVHTEPSIDTLEASNYRRSNLNLTKTVSGENVPDSYFTFKATVTDTNSTDGKVWFSAWDPKANATVKDTDWVISGATAQKGNTGYWFADNGAEVTFKIKAGWNVRFLNLYHGSTFSFEETAMPDVFEFDSITAAHQFSFMDQTITDASWYKVVDKKTEGTIIEPNNSYTFTYTNKVAPYFYVYHSSVEGDGDLTKYPVTETFDIFATTKPGTLYGGYYLDYEGKGKYADDGVKATEGVAYNGMNVTWDYKKACEQDGREMTPVAGETYYVKEVPTYYLRNYYQVNYAKAAPQAMKGLYLVSAIDDNNYLTTGFKLNGEETTENVRVGKSISFKNWATGFTVTLKPNSAFFLVDGKKAITVKDVNFLTFLDVTSREGYDSPYYKPGTFTVLPYWTTFDGITVNGISTRTVTITEMTKNGISKTDSK